MVGLGSQRMVAYAIRFARRGHAYHCEARISVGIGVCAVANGRKRGGQRSGVEDAAGAPSGIFGRAGELERIQQLLDTARGGRTVILVLQGEAGIGKTTLLREAARRADGMTALTARGVGPEAEVPYSGLYDALRPLLKLLRRLPSTTAALSVVGGVASDFDELVPDAVGATTTSPAPVPARPAAARPVGIAAGGSLGR